MAKIQTITLIEDLHKEDSNAETGSKYFNPIFNDLGSLVDRAKDNLKNRAIRTVLSFGQYKKYWLPVDKELNLPKNKDLKPESKFREFFQPVWNELKDKVTLSISLLQVTKDGVVSAFNADNPQENLDRVEIHAVAIFNAQDILNAAEIHLLDYLGEAQEKPPIEEEPEIVEPEIKADESNEPTHKVYLTNKSHFLALRDEPSKEIITHLDVYTGTGESAVAIKFPVQAGSLGGLVGLLPHGTKVRMEVPGWGDGSPGNWPLVKIIEGPPPALVDGVSNLDPKLIGVTAYVDGVGLSKLPTQETVEDIITDLGNPEFLSDDDLDKIALVKEYLNPPLFDIKAHEVNPFVAATNVGPPQDWTRRTPYEIVKNKAERRFEVVVELDFLPEVAYLEEGTEDPKAYKEAKKNEARKEGLRAILRYYNRVSDDAYILKLLNRGQGEVSQIEGFWADDNPNNRKIYYLVAIPATGAGAFNYKSHKPAETLTLEEMIVERVIDFQYVFMTNKIENQVSETIKILKNTIKPGLDSYDGFIKNKPDIDYEIKKLESLVPAIKEVLSENNVKFRPDKEDLIEIGLDSGLSVIYIRYGPQDGKDGDWKIIAPWAGGS